MIYPDDVADIGQLAEKVFNLVSEQNNPRVSLGVLAGVYSVIAFECGFDPECFSLALDNMKKTYELRYRGILKDGNP